MALIWRGPQVKAQIEAGTRRGVDRAALRLASLAKPLTPNLEGDLEGSQNVQSNNSLDEPSAAVVYDTPYAVRQHEEMGYRHTTSPNPNAQAKYLEGPLVENADELTAIIGAELRRAVQ